MRTIKFRGKDQAGIWHFGDLIHGENAIFIDATYSEILGLISPTKVLPETIGEFTGATDCNECEIYEGDIMRIKGNHNRGFGIVTWHQNGFFYIDDSFGKFPRDCVKPIGDFLAAIGSHFKGMELEVCGNIHETPELIKK